MTRERNSTDLVRVFVPSLTSVLLRNELDKGRPLTEQEVTAIRDKSITIVLHTSEALRLAEKRAYNDVDPARCWETWRKLRTKLKPLQRGGVVICSAHRTPLARRASATQRR